MNKPTLQIGNGNWGSKDGSLLGYVEGDTIDKFAPVFLDSTRGSNIAATRVGKDGLIEKGRRNLLSFSNNFDNPIWIGGASWVGGQEGYDGTNNAWNFTKDHPTNSDLYDESFSGLQTFSIYAKKEDNKGLKIIAFHTGGNKRASFNLATGEDVAAASHQDIHSHAEDLNNGWWRLSFTVNQTNAKWYLYTTDGTNTQIVTTVTLQNAQLEYGMAPSKYINTGSSVNLLRNTNQIQETPWTVSSGMDTITPNQLGYDGTRDAFLMTKDAAWARIEQKIPKGISEDLVLSAYVKSNALDNVVFRVDSDHDDADNREVLAEVRVNIDTLQKNTQNHGAKAHLTKVGDGWTRVEMRFDGARTTGSAESYDLEIFIYPAHQTDGAGGTTGSIFIQDIQLEIGTEASPYVENSEFAGILDDSPRIDYTDSDGYLVMEPTRANLHLHSEYRAAAGFYNSNETYGFKSPDGSNNAIKIQADSSDTGHFVVNGMVSVTSDEEYTASVFVKAGNNISDVKFGISDQQATTNFAYAYFDITGDGTVGVSHEGGTGSLVSKTIEKIGTDGWYRVSVTGTITDTSIKSVLFMSDDGADPVGFEDSTANMYVYGWQLEEGSFATSYIPTHGASVTRKQDQIVLEKDLAYEAWTVYMEVDNMTINGAPSNVGHWRFRAQSDITKECLFFFGTCFGYNTTDTSAPAYPKKYICGELGNTGDVFSGKFAVTYDGSNTMKVYVDGSLEVTKTDVDPTNTKGIQKAELQYNGDAYLMTRNYKDLRVYDKELTQAEAEALTS